MAIESVNIIGITGGVGYHFFLECKSQSSVKNICGLYFSNAEKANEIKIDYPDVQLIKADLSCHGVSNYSLPNYECLAFFAGETFFSENVFDANNSELIKQLNLHTVSVLKMIFELLEYKQHRIKKIILIYSYSPENVKSIYHFSKLLLEKAIELLLPSLEEKGISISVVYSGWIDTKMYKLYKENNPNFQNLALKPSYVAKICIEELKTTLPINIVRL